MKKLLTSIWLFLFSKKDHHKATRLKIIAVINGIKDAVNHPVAGMIARAIPGRTDDAILECIRKWLPVILKEFSLSENGLNTGVAIRQAVETLRIITPEERSRVYKVVAGRLYESFSGLPLDTAIEAVQMEYYANA